MAANCLPRNLSHMDKRKERLFKASYHNRCVICYPANFPAIASYDGFDHDLIKRRVSILRLFFPMFDLSEQLCILQFSKANGFISFNVNDGIC